MAGTRKTRGPDSGFVTKKRIPTKKEITYCKLVVGPTNYGPIAKGLGLHIGPDPKHKLHEALVLKKIDRKETAWLIDDRNHILSLYNRGYDVNYLWAELVSRIQEEILKGLPF